jgi:hypothetical protein
MSQSKKTDPLDDWLFRFFKAGMFLTGIVAIYRLLDRELHINEFTESLVDLRLVKFGGLASAFLFALYLLIRRSHE